MFAHYTLKTPLHRPRPSAFIRGGVEISQEERLEICRRLGRNQDMAWRIDENVIRGEIDNRQKGVMRGRLWLAGLASPVVIELAGNACADLAGCWLKFTNPQPPVPMRTDAVFAPEQRGRIGDLTASRKVRVFDVPLAEAQAMFQRGERPPEHLANCLYLEWFSERNVRVVIENTGFEIEISPPAWRLTPADEQQRLTDTQAGWSGFLGKLDEAVNQHQRVTPPPDDDWDEHDYERFLKASDARTDKHMELIEKYGDSDAAQEKIAEEMGWTRELTDEEAAAEQRHIDDLNAACEAAQNEPPPEPDPLREGIDWIRTDAGEIQHPLEHRCREAALRVWRQCDKLGLNKFDDADLAQFLTEFQITGAKLAGALGDIADGLGSREPAFTVACLKRALDHLHKSQAALETVAAKRRPSETGDPLLPELIVVEARRELFAIREGILLLTQELREQQ